MDNLPEKITAKEFDKLSFSYAWNHRDQPQYKWLETPQLSDYDPLHFVDIDISRTEKLNIQIKHKNTYPNYSPIMIEFIFNNETTFNYNIRTPKNINTFSFRENAIGNANSVTIFIMVGSSDVGMLDMELKDITLDI